MSKSIQDAINKLGLVGVANLYDPQISPQAVHKWIDDGVPINRCLAIELAMGGEITRKDLRPDDWHLIWPELTKAA